MLAHEMFWICTVLECHVDGEDSPEAALRQVDQHALMSMFCALGCDHVVNTAIPHAFSTYVPRICSVKKDEHDVELKKYTAKDDKDDKARRMPRWMARGPGSGMERRDIDAYTVGSATLRFSCTDQDGVDYTKEAAERIGLELSICKQRPWSEVGWNSF